MKNTSFDKDTLYFNLIVTPEQKNHSFYSLSPDQSDLATNQLILNALVGTLVKYGNDGKIEPYLAESIDSNETQLNWKFKLRENLICQDGTLITAKKFKSNLENHLKKYAKSGTVLEFEKLTGWKKFLDSNSLDGILADENNNLTFSFSKKPIQFLEFLRMPYFGFWCESNFDENLNYKPNQNFVSSGAYQVVSDSENKLSLSLRKNWFSIDQKNSFEKIVFQAILKEDISNFSGANSIIHYGVNDPVNVNKDNFSVILGVPSLLTNLIISPYSSVFSKKEARQRLYSNIFNSNFKPESKNRIRSKNFIRHEKNEVSPTFSDFKPNTTATGLIRIAIGTPLSDNDLNPIKEAIKKSLPSAKVEFLYPDKTDKNWRSKLLSNKEYDARIATVDAGGGTAINPAIKMIFCSELGVKYPDPSGRICALATKYENEQFDVDEKYIAEFNKILSDDASVLPLYFGSISWLVAKSINVDSLPSAAMYVQFEKIKKNE